MFGDDLYGTADSDIESETEGMNTVVGKCKDHRATWLMRLDILHSVDHPVLVFSAPIIPFGTLVPINDNSADPDVVFRLVINAIDSSLWLIYEFKRYTDVGCENYIIGEGDEWGKLAPDDVPFTAARIADIAELEKQIGQSHCLHKAGFVVGLVHLGPMRSTMIFFKRQYPHHRQPVGGASRPKSLMCSLPLALASSAGSDFVQRLLNSSQRSIRPLAFGGCMFSMRESRSIIHPNVNKP